MATIPERIRLAVVSTYRRKAFRYHDLEEEKGDLLHGLLVVQKRNALKGRIDDEVNTDADADTIVLYAFRRRHQRNQSFDHKDVVNLLDIVGNSIQVISVIADEKLEHCQKTTLLEMVYNEAIPELAKRNVAVPYQSICDIIMMTVDAYVGAFAVAS